MTLRFPPPTHPAALRAPHLAAAMFALSCCSAAADIVAAPGAPAALSPQITAGGGATRIDIAPPNAAGVSLNQYDRFDVEAAGAVLNNAVGDTRSELLGELAANARLNGRAAQLIVNQVLGDDPSRLRGMLEVAGARADVIVANPHGIDCDGCGFIGAARATLLAGEVQLDGAEGRLRTLSAADSELRIGALGLRDHARAAERIDLIARRIAVAGRVDARDLRLVTGLNRVDAASGDVQGIADAAPAHSGYALDVAAAGAMHAGRIHLIATEAGAGVRSAGELKARTQDLRLDVAGELRLTKAHARRDLTIAAAGPVEFDHDATIGAERNVTLRGVHLINQGIILAEGDLKLDLGEVYNAGGTVRSGRDLLLRSTDSIVNGRTAQIIAGGKLDLVGTHHLDNHGDIEAGSVRLELGENFNNRMASLKSLNGDIEVGASAIDNRNGSIQAAAALRTRLPAPGTLRNGDGVIRAGAGETNIAAGTLSNGGHGAILVDGDLQLAVAELSNTEGRITVQGRAQLECRDKLDNGSAQLRAERGLTLNVGSEADNDHGSIESGGDLQFSLRGILSNLGGRVSAAQGELRLQALSGTVVNDGGDIGAGHALRLDAAALSNRQKSRLMAEDVSLHVGELDNAGGRIVAQRTLRIAASALDNGDGGRIVAGDSAELELERHLRNGGGRIHVHGDALVMRVPLGEIDNRDGEFRLPLAQSRWIAKTVHGELPPIRP